MCPSHIGMAEGSAEGNGKRGLDKTGNDGAGFAAQARLYQEVQRPDILKLAGIAQEGQIGVECRTGQDRIIRRVGGAFS